MSAPEKIFVTVEYIGKTDTVVCGAFGTSPMDESVEFTRTDLSQASVAAALEAAKDALNKMPRREERLGGQRTQYIQLHEAVETIAALITPAQHDALAAHVAAEVAKARADDAAKLLAAAGQEYVLEHVMETDWHRQGRHSAVRGMMVRMGIYAELEGAIDAAITQIGAKP